MKTTIPKITRAGLLAGALFAVGTAFAIDEYENSIQKSFPIGPGGSLVVVADRGSIDVTTADAEKVEVQVFRKVRGISRSRADEIFAAHEVNFQRQGDQVAVHAQFHGASGGLFNRGASSLQVRYQINIPKKFNVDLKTAGGGITSTDLTGTVRTQTSGGSLKLAKIDGPVWGKTAGGNISLTSSSGDVEVSTSGGGIRLSAAADLAVDLDVKTSGGRVTTELPVNVQGEQKSSELRGKINDGGLVLVLRTTGGSIYLKKK